MTSVRADPDGKKQHVVETFNVVDVGTSVLVEAVVRDDFTSETVLMAVTHTLLEHGRPTHVTFDRDPRFVGSWAGRDFPSPLVRFLFCLDIAVTICPPHRPDKNAFVERYHRSYGEECVAVHLPRTCPDADAVTQHYKQHYNWERPNQAITCTNQPPRIAFPDLPKLPSLPAQVDPDHWLQAIDGQRYRRRVSSNGTITVDNRSYYVRSSLKGHYVTALVDARHRQLIVEHNKQAIKCIPIKGLYDDVLDFEDYYSAIRQEARTHWQRVTRRRYRVVTM